MTLPFALRRLLSRLRFGRSPQVPAVRPERDYARGVAQVPQPLPENETTWISLAQARAAIGESVDRFPAPHGQHKDPMRPAKGRLPDVHQPTDAGNGDPFDRNSGNHHLRRFL